MSIELSFLSDPQVGGISLDNFCEGVFPISAAFEGAPKETECKPPSKAAFRKFAAEHGAGARRNLAEMQLEASNATAPMQNNQELAQILMKYGKNKYGWSALNYAINCEDYHAAIILINNGADCFFRDKNNYNIYSPIERLFLYSFNGNGPKVHDASALDWRLTPFPENKQESARLLTSMLLKEYVLHKGDKSCFDHPQAVMEGLIVNKWYDLLEYLCEKKDFLGFAHIIRWTSLYNWLVGRKDLETMFVLDKFSSPVELKERVITLEARLSMAIGHNSLEMVKHFVECGASVKGSLSAALKVKQENRDVIEFLISKGATL